MGRPVRECENRQSNKGLNVTFFDTEWKRLPFERHYPVDVQEIKRPQTYEEMCNLAEKLSQRMVFSRIDFYEISGRPYFGEITFYPGSGMEKFTPEKWDEELGKLIHLPQKCGGRI